MLIVRFFIIKSITMTRVIADNKSGNQVSCLGISLYFSRKSKKNILMNCMYTSFCIFLNHSWKIIINGLNVFCYYNQIYGISLK